jgi:phage host-nuclease inhibitor protein Gam
MAPKPKTPRAQANPEPRFRTLDECDAALVKIASLTRDINTCEAATNEQITALRTKLEVKVDPLCDQKKDLEQQLELFCTFHRDTVFASGLKTLKLTHGELNFRQHPPSVEIRKGGKFKIADVVANIKERFAKALRERFVRIKEDLDREAILGHASALNGKPLASFEDQLTLCGAQIVRDKETFGYNLYEEAIAEKLGARPRVLDVKAAAR